MNYVKVIFSGLAAIFLAWVVILWPLFRSISQERYRGRYGYLPQTLAADTNCGNGELLHWLNERGIAAYIGVKENRNGPTDSL